MNQGDTIIILSICLAVAVGICLAMVSELSTSEKRNEFLVRQVAKLTTARNDALGIVSDQLSIMTAMQADYDELADKHALLVLGRANLDQDLKVLLEEGLLHDYRHLADSGQQVLPGM